MNGKGKEGKGISTQEEEQRTIRAAHRPNDT